MYWKNLCKLIYALQLYYRCPRMYTCVFFWGSRYPGLYTYRWNTDFPTIYNLSQADVRAPLLAISLTPILISLSLWTTVHHRWCSGYPHCDYINYIVRLYISREIPSTIFAPKEPVEEILIRKFLPCWTSTVLRLYILPSTGCLIVLPTIAQTFLNDLPLGLRSGET